MTSLASTPSRDAKPVSSMATGTASVGRRGRAGPRSARRSRQRSRVGPRRKGTPGRERARWRCRRPPLRPEQPQGDAVRPRGPLVRQGARVRSGHGPTLSRQLRALIDSAWPQSAAVTAVWRGSVGVAAADNAFVVSDRKLPLAGRPSQPPHATPRGAGSGTHPLPAGNALLPWDEHIEPRGPSHDGREMPPRSRICFGSTRVSPLASQREAETIGTEPRSGPDLEVPEYRRCGPTRPGIKNSRAPLPKMFWHDLKLTLRGSGAGQL